LNCELEAHREVIGVLNIAYLSTRAGGVNGWLALPELPRDELLVAQTSLKESRTLGQGMPSFLWKCISIGNRFKKINLITFNQVIRKFGFTSMNKQEFISALISVTIISIVIISVISFAICNARLIGPVMVLLGFIPWVPLRISGRTIKSVGADIVFGAIDTGILGIAALIGASFAGVFGAIVGGAVGDSITDGFAGLFEGKVAEYLRKHGIEEARTPLSSSMGKMSGCLIGVGIVLTIAWSILEIKFS